MAEDIDLKDIEILKLLRKDSRMSMGAIGDELNLSKATVSRRMSRMEADGIVTGYDILLDPTKMRLMRSMISLQVVSNPVSVVIEHLASIKEIRNIYKAFGDHHIVCEVYTKSVDDLYTLIQSRLLNMPSIRNLEVDILVEKIELNPSADLDIYAGHNNIK